MIRYLIGWVLCIEAAFMLIPAVLSVAFGESNFIYFLWAIGLAFGLGHILCHKKPKNTQFYAKEGFVAVALCWVFMSLFGALPFWFSQCIPHYYDALFEIISGFTTTGSSILTDVEALPKSMLFWRSFTHWLGGMGVLVFLLAILPMTGGHSLYLMKAESPGPSVGKLVPRLQQTAVYLYGIYFVLTIVCFVCLLVAKMPWFDAICITFGTAGTGGFAVLASGCADYTIAQQVIITVFMLAFGVNFNFYFFLLMKKFKGAFSISEVWYYLAIFAFAALAITVNIQVTGTNDPWWITLKDAAFQCSTIMTTTGFATADFNLWPQFSRCILVLLMFIGACAGSTGGGIKVSRIMLYVKSIRKEWDYLIHPRRVKVIRMDGQAVDKTVLHSAHIFLLAYVFIFAISVLIVSLDNFDFGTTFTAVAATFNNIGPGLEVVGPYGSFASLSVLSKCVLMFDMLAGRLEIFPMLLLIIPSTWRKNN